MTRGPVKSPGLIRRVLPHVPDVDALTGELRDLLTALLAEARETNRMIRAWIDRDDLADDFAADLRDVDDHSFAAGERRRLRDAQRELEKGGHNG